MSAHRIAGARRAGLCVVWMHNGGWGKPEAADGVIHDLAELPELVHRFSNRAAAP